MIAFLKKFNKNVLLVVPLFTIILVPIVVLGETEYTALTTIPGATVAKEPVSPMNLLKNVYGISIIIASTLAVAVIIFGGIEYATSEALQKKSGGKERIQNAIFGLVLLLSSYIILRTINIDLVNFNLTLGVVKPDSRVDLGVLESQLKNTLDSSINTTQSILNSTKKQQESVAATVVDLQKQKEELEKTLTSTTTPVSAQEKIAKEEELNYINTVLESRKKDDEYLKKINTFIEEMKNFTLVEINSAKVDTKLIELKKELESETSILKAKLDEVEQNSYSKSDLHLESRITTLKEKTSEISRAGTTVNYQRRLYSSFASDYLKTKPSQLSISDDAFKKELLQKNLIYNDGINKFNGKPFDILSNYTRSKFGNYQEINNITNTYNTAILNELNRSVDRRVDCFSKYKKTKPVVPNGCVNF